MPAVVSNDFLKSSTDKPASSICSAANCQGSQNTPLRKVFLTFDILSITAPIELAMFVQSSLPLLKSPKMISHVSAHPD